MTDLTIRNGRVVTPQGVIYGGLATEGGKITCVDSDSRLPQGKRVIDARGNYLIPGLIDAHVHVGLGVDAPIEEGLEAQFARETLGALYGGVTTFGQFVTAVVGASLKSSCDANIRIGERLSYVDFFLHGCIADQNQIAEEEELHRRGTTSFKHFFNIYKFPDGAGKFAPTDEGMLYRSFESIVRRGFPGLGMCHCEEMDLIFLLQDRLQKAGRTDLLAWTEARPNLAEAMRISHALYIAKATQCPFYVVHISTEEGAELVAQARREGFQVYGETCPHYLTHSGLMEEQIGCWGKVNPPLKYPKDNEALWRNIRAGGITNFGTDHGAGTIARKEKGGGKHNNIWKAHLGICGGMEHMLPVMMTHGVNAGRITIEDLVRVCSTNNARVFGIYPRKGVLAPGSDADIVIVDTEKEAVISPAFYHCMGDYTIYDGWKVRGMARATIIRGEVMMEEYEAVGKPGHGRHVPCHS